MLQQCLPFMVLKRYMVKFVMIWLNWLQQCLPFMVLKQSVSAETSNRPLKVATVLTIYGIETIGTVRDTKSDTGELQQCLPFMVLKHDALTSPYNYRLLGCNSAYHLWY